MYSSTGDAWKSDREWCMKVMPETMPKALEKFFFDGKVFRKGLVERLTSKLEEIEIVLRENGNWRMYGSSLLVVYDGAEEEPDIVVKMIDFSHIVFSYIFDKQARSPTTC